mgnify:FL=1|tara:strand:+ start:44249 stop:44668 length:420 start_codon:yes stop_codon:yes gene_type:complete
MSNQSQEFDHGAWKTGADKDALHSILGMLAPISSSQEHAEHTVNPQQLVRELEQKQRDRAYEHRPTPINVPLVNPNVPQQHPNIPQAQTAPPVDEDQLIFSFKPPTSDELLKMIQDNAATLSGIRQMIIKLDQKIDAKG